jgi:hypothetical protein
VFAKRRECARLIRPGSWLIPLPRRRAAWGEREAAERPSFRLQVFVQATSLPCRSLEEIRESLARSLTCEGEEGGEMWSFGTQ